MSGYPDGSPITNWGDYISENDQARVRAVWEEFIATGAPTASAEWQWTNGRWGEDVAQTVADYSGCGCHTSRR